MFVGTVAKKGHYRVTVTSKSARKPTRRGTGDLAMVVEDVSSTIPTRL